MIRSFRCRDTQQLFETGRCARFHSIEVTAVRKLSQLNQAMGLSDLRSPSGNRLEALRGNRFGQHRIRINAKFRLCFHWSPHEATEVEIVDYH